MWMIPPWPLRRIAWSFLLTADSLAHKVAVGFGDAHRSLRRRFHELQAEFLAGPENPRIGSTIGIGFRRLLSCGLEHDVHAAVVSQSGGPLVAPHPSCRFLRIAGLEHLYFFHFELMFLACRARSDQVGGKPGGGQPHGGERGGRVEEQGLGGPAAPSAAIGAGQPRCACTPNIS